jgi:hypothetical protein
LEEGLQIPAIKKRRILKKKEKKKKIYNNENTSLYIKVFPPPGYLAG